MRKVSLLIALLLAAATAQGETKVKHRFQSSVPARGIEEVVIEILASEMTIANGEPTTISVKGLARQEFHRIDGLAEAQRIADATEVRIETRGSKAYVSRSLGPAARGRSWGDQAELDFEIMVPKGLSIRVLQKAGEIDIEGDFGNIDVQMKAGEVRVSVPKINVKELSARAHIGEVTTNLGEKIISKEGILAGRTEYYNEQGSNSLIVNLTVGEIHIALTQ